MKRLYYILASLLLVAGCAKNLPDPVQQPVLDQNIKVPVSFNLLTPSDASTRTMANEPEIDHICVAVFGASGFFNEWIVASIDNVEEVNYNGTAATKYNIRINLTMSDSRLRLHFIANGPVEAPLTGQPAKDSEDGMMGRLTSQLADSHNDGYWQKVVLPLGVHAQTWINTDNNPPTIEYWKDPNTGQYVPTEETVEQFPDPIKLVRNFARIRVKLSEGSDLTAISRIALAYVPIEGSFAPVMAEAINTDEYGAYSATETDYLDRFVPAYSDLSDEALTAAPYNYKGYFPSTIQLGGYGDDKTRAYPSSDSEMTAWAADQYLYVYERTVPTSDRPATRLVVKATHRTDGEKYYRIDLHDNGANYPLLRNHTYIVSIGNVATGTGRDNPKDAAESPSTSDISAEVTDLPEVSDGIAQIAVQFIENTYVVGGETHTLDFTFIPLIETGTPDNTKVRIQLGTGVGNSFVPNGTSGNGPAISGTPTISNTDQEWGRITFTLTDNNANKFQTIRVIGTKNDGSEIYRDVVIYLKMKQLMTVECIDKYVLEQEDQRELVRVYIPGDLSKSMFPMEFKVEPTSGALNPDGENMPVNSGTSLTGSGATVFYFIKTLTWEDYQALPSLAGDSRKYFECNFKTTKAQNEGEVWVSNAYFLNGADDVSGNNDEYFNYTKRYFTNLMFSARVDEGNDVDFAFTMDAAHSGTEKMLPEVVTVTLNGLEPQDGYTGLTKVEGENDVYLYSPGGNSIATLRLTATDEYYSVVLSTEHNSNPLLYEDASREKSDPCPEVTGITVSPATSAVRVGSGVTLTANVSGTMTDGIPVTWTSSDTDIATVNELGVVTGVALGEVTITATAGGKSVTANVTVAEPSVTSISVTPNSATVSTRSTTTLTATREGLFVEDLPVVWSSSDESIATVNANGVVTGVAAGTATITATSGGLSASATVTVVNLVSFSLTGGNDGNNYNQRNYSSNQVSLSFSSARRRADYIQMARYSTLSVRSDDKVITRIEVTYYSNRPMTLTSGGGTFTSGVWTGESNNVTFTAYNNNNSTQISSIRVYYKD